MVCSDFNVSAKLIPIHPKLIFWAGKELFVCLHFFHIFVLHLSLDTIREMNLDSIRWGVMILHQGPQSVHHNLTLCEHFSIHCHRKIQST